jgi:hypothetical protein
VTVSSVLVRCSLMSLTVRLILLATITILAIGLFSGSPSMAQADADDKSSTEWVHLGPPSLPFAGVIAVSPDWPKDRFILAANRDTVVRSYDGGQTWETLSKVITPQQPIVTKRRDGRRLIFSINDVGGRLHRSHDEGATWETILERPNYWTFSLRPSPTFDRDGLLLATLDGALLRSADVGTTWEQIEPAPGQRVQQVEFSPAYEDDRIIFASVASTDFAIPLADKRDPDRIEGNARSVGMMLSKDEGNTWTPISNGLEIDGAPYRAVQQFAISPQFAVDGTLVALTWGPLRKVPPGLVDFRTSFAVFRSTNGGASWSVQGRPGEYTGEPGVYGSHDYNIVLASFVLSPRFGDDGTGLLMATTGYGTPGTTNCVALRTVDHGAAWAQIPIRDNGFGLSWGGDGACGRTWLTHADQRVIGYAWRGQGTITRTRHWWMSTDGGLIWDPLPGIRPRSSSEANGAAVIPDGTILVGASDGIWASGPRVVPALAPVQVP